MSVLDYPFDSAFILQKKKSIKKELLTKNNFIEKKVAIMSGSTIGEIKNILELFRKYALDNITAVSVSDEGMVGAIYDDRIEIDFGTVLDIDYKIKMCKKILDEKIPEGEKGAIDATEGGEVVYKRQ